MSRSQIDRLTGRIEALQAQRKPPEQRGLTVLGRNHMRADEELARFCAEHGVTDSDLLIAQILVPFETRPGETAKDAYERELRAMARNDDHGRQTVATARKIADSVYGPARHDDKPKTG